MPEIAILGAGTMGHGIAQVFATAGWAVRLYDPDSGALAAAPGRIRRNYDPFLALGMQDVAGVEAALGRIALCPELETACRGAAVVMECAPERLELKQALFAQAEAAAGPEVLLCSNTSALPITDIGRDLADPSRLVGAHFWNPPHIVPCVEIVAGRATSAEAYERAAEIVEAAGKVAVRVRKEVPGFLGNRLQHALQREALYLVEAGIAEPEDVDKVVKHGFGLRYALMGPLERADLGGLDVTYAVQGTVLPDLDNRTEPSPLLAQRVAAGQLGLKTGQGFYQWTPERRQHLVAGRDLALLSIIKLVEDLQKA
jgi:3-hydroxybutyryl-CoA dehydrogenase